MSQPPLESARPPFLLTEATILGLPGHYRGKVRDNYDLLDGRRIIIATDRLSAFDRILTAIPYKGQVLTQVARFWFDRTLDICPNHSIDYPDPNVVVGRRLTILPVEMVVRGYLAGTTATSIWTMYKAGARTMYGLTLPEGMRENEKLPENVITPTSKAVGGAHDEPLTPARILEERLLTPEQWETASRYALALFARGQAMAEECGLILADTKYEFGIDDEGRIVLADEIHTPDSSRYWFAGTYRERFERGERPESFDKDFVRNWVAERCDPYRDEIPPIPDDLIWQTSRVYASAYERITGLPFEPPPPDEDILGRIRANLARYL
jgi:phosphoribosylaminoimidazole-succinocarboxamide synthase